MTDELSNEDFPQVPSTYASNMISRVAHVIIQFEVILANPTHNITFLVRIDTAKLHIVNQTNAFLWKTSWRV
jgi:hypothetical protein